MTEKNPEEASSAEKQEVPISAHTRKPKRTMEELCANVPEETVIVDLPEEEKFTADGRPLKCIGTDDVRVELIREPSRVYCYCQARMAQNCYVMMSMQEIIQRTTQG